ESFIGYRDLSAEFEDCSDNSINEVNAVGAIVPTVGQNSFNNTNTFSVAGPSNAASSPTYGKSSFIDASQFLDDPDMPELEDITYSDDVGVEADFSNLETSITEELLQFKMQKVWVLVDLPHGKKPLVPNRFSRIKSMKEALWSGTKQDLLHKDTHRRRELTMNKSLLQTIEEEVYVCQPPGFEDPDHSDKVYKVVKVLYGLHQALRAWYETLANYLLENGFQRGKIDQTLFIKRQKADERKVLDEFNGGTHILFGSLASTPIDTKKPLLKDPDGKDIDVHTYRHMLLVLVQKFLLFSLTNCYCTLSAVRSSSRKFNFSKYIFESLMRNVDNTTKFYMYPRFLQLIIRKQVGDLSTHTTKYTLPALTQKNRRLMKKEMQMGMLKKLILVMLLKGDASTAHGEVPTVAAKQSIPSPTPPTPPPQPPQDIPSTLQVQQTPPQSPQVQLPSPQPQPQHQPQPPQIAGFPMRLLQEAMDACVALTRRVEHLEYDKVAQALEITKLKRRVKKLEKRNKVRVLKLRRLKRIRTSQRVETSDDTVMDNESNQGKMIAEIDQDKKLIKENKEGLQGSRLWNGERLKEVGYGSGGKRGEEASCIQTCAGEKFRICPLLVPEVHNWLCKFLPCGYTIFGLWQKRP
nr:putative ribonuclease H-like domain-containing protein [Tanacetum cinerariifolium]GEX67831.1 putative ribonuclease H-like domain-containing protein [Tanacetum cinerariifolium]